MTRYKLFLPSLLLTVKRTMVARFPTTTKTQISAKALHIAMPSVLEGELPFAELDSFTLLMFATIAFPVMFLIWFSLSSLK